MTTHCIRFTLAAVIAAGLACKAVALDFVPDQSLLPTQGSDFTDNVPYYSPIGEIFTATTLSLNVVALDVLLYDTSMSEIVRVQLYQGVGGPLVATSNDVLIPSNFNTDGRLMTEFFFPQTVSLNLGSDYFICLNQPDNDANHATFLGGHLGPGPYNNGIRAGSPLEADYFFAEGTFVPEPGVVSFLAVAIGLFVVWRRRSARVRPNHALQPTAGRSDD